MFFGPIRPAMLTDHRYTTFWTGVCQLKKNWITTIWTSGLTVWKDQKSRKSESWLRWPRLSDGNPFEVNWDFHLICLFWKTWWNKHPPNRAIVDQWMREKIKNCWFVVVGQNKKAMTHGIGVVVEFSGYQNQISSWLRAYTHSTPIKW